MAALWKLSFALLSMSLFINLSSSEEPLTDSEHDPILGDFSDVTYWRPPGWIDCNFTATPGASCLDCNTILICKRIGGFLIPCWFPGKNHCVDGECAATPSEECAPSTTTTETAHTTEPWDLENE